MKQERVTELAGVTNPKTSSFYVRLLLQHVPVQPIDSESGGNWLASLQEMWSGYPDAKAKCIALDLIPGELPHVLWIQEIIASKATPGQVRFLLAGCPVYEISLRELLLQIDRQQPDVFNFVTKDISLAQHPETAEQCLIRKVNCLLADIAHSMVYRKLSNGWDLHEAVMLLLSD